jgi:hypothetical protein
MKECKKKSEGQLHPVLCQENFARKFPLAFLEDVVPLKYRVEVSEQKLLAGGFPADLPRQRGRKVSCSLSFIGEGTLQNQKVRIPPQSYDVGTVIGIPRIGQRSTGRLHSKSNTGSRMGHGECFYFNIRERQVALPDFMEKERVGLGFDPRPKNSVELIIESPQAMGANHLQRKRANKIHRVVHGKKEGHEVGDVVRVKMGDAEIIDLAKIEAQPGHLSQRPASAVKKNEMRI